MKQYEMIMLKRTDFILKALHVIAWIIFIGLCIETGGLIVNTLITIFINPLVAKNFWGGHNLYEIYQFNQFHFITMVVIMIIVSVLKSILFYLIVHLFHKKKLNLTNPFNNSLGKYLFNLSYLAFGIGLFSYWGNNFSKYVQLLKPVPALTTVQNIRFEGADVWLFMGVILLVFALIFEKGISLQSESDLTI